MATSPDASGLTTTADPLPAGGEASAIHAILASAAVVVRDAEHVSLTMRHRNGFTTLAATSPVADRVDQLQYQLSEGPSVDVATTVESLRSGDIAGDLRWPRWGPRAAEEGLRSLLSVELTTRGDRLGALTMYAGETGRFEDAQTHRDALRYGTLVAYALSSARLVGRLEAAMESRHSIGLAQGVLMERYRVDVDQAFALLRRVSSLQNRKLRDVADELVRTGTVDKIDLRTLLP